MSAHIHSARQPHSVDECTLVSQHSITDYTHENMTHQIRCALIGSCSKEIPTDKKKPRRRVISPAGLESVASALGSTRCDNRTSASDQNRDGSHAHTHGGRAGRSEGISARLRRGGSVLGCRGGRLRRFSTRGDVDASGHRALIVGGSVRLRCGRGGVTVGRIGRRSRRSAIAVRGS